YLASLFCQYVRPLPKETRQQISMQEVSRLAERAYSDATKSVVATFTTMASYEMPPAFRNGLPRPKGFESAQARADTLQALQQKISSTPQNDPEAVAATRQLLDDTVARAHYSALLDASSEIFSRYAKQAEEGQKLAVDETQCVAELFVAAGDLTVRECGGDVLKY